MFDILGISSSNLNGNIKKAFGEIISFREMNMKQKIEKFLNTLLILKGKEYNTDKGDYAFMIE